MSVCDCIYVSFYVYFSSKGRVAVLGRGGIGTGLGYVAVIKEGNSL